jgi:ATP-dependent RNA helicase DeaD
LQERGFTAALLSGELGQHERNLSIQALRDGRARVCVATDVAARGLDLPSVGLVIHADLPHDAEALQHRSGRTGRAGRKGVSVLLVPAKARRRVENLFAHANVVPAWQAPPSAEEIRKLDRARMAQDPAFQDEASEEENEIAAALLAEHGAEKCAAALARLLRTRLPEAEEVADPGAGPDFSFEKGARGKPPGGKNAPLEGGVWFRLDIGRKNNADPKWMLPMLCRNGGVNRADIGAIRIFPTDSKVEIAGAAAESFFKNMRRPGGENIRIERVGGAPAPREARPPKDKKRKGPKPHQ